MLFQLFVLFGAALLGQVISGLLPFAFPGTLIAALILFFLLEWKVIQLDDIEEITHLSNKYLAFVFIPAGVAIMEYFLEFSPVVWLKIFFVVILSTGATMIVTGKVSDGMIALKKKRDGGEKNA